MALTLSGLMLYAMWLVLGVMGLSFVVDLFKSFSSGTFSSSTITNYLRDLLYFVFPLFLLSNMMPLDHTDFIIKIAYYIGVVGVLYNYVGGYFKK
ncbi:MULTISPECIES: hypothetical protein [unclassified Paenibacillus]|jgi:accessory gene regulator protein AgrB|uniref:hypothetical protein n=1 Tax=unclassified Paenibacillus TaxID=185978 RepID=UPI0006FD4977|nr:hypothetical protein [Paenibacillus sp. Soil750]KRE56712.1 hypothetical protein ASL11_33675 [Paenibacillus sp. Soil750]